jgi:2,4-dienoyl-CoA reductase (NADPH2)
MSRHERFALKSREDLAEKARALGVEIPFARRIDALFRPITLPGGRRLPNRLVIHPMEGADGTEDGGPGDLTVRRYRRFAAGGCGLIWIEATAVDAAGRSNPRQLYLAKRTLGGFKSLVDEIRSAGAARGDDPALILQLTHSGRFSKPAGTPRPVIGQHNPWLDPLVGIRPEDPVVRDDELERLQKAFVEAAGMAAEAGFDGVDIKACHGYLAGELLASRERSGSRFGGGFENRTRFLVETVSAIRSRFPALLLASRLGVYDALPYPYGFGVDGDGAEREDLTEPIALAGRLAGAGIALINITIGIPAFKAHYGRPFDKPPAGGTVPEEHPLESVARLLRTAAAIQEACPEIPVVGTGYSWLRGLVPGVAAGVLEEGGASLIGLGRLSFAYPDFARDLETKGRLDSKKLCLACSGCTELLRAGGPAGCVVRDKGVYSRKRGDRVHRPPVFSYNGSS